MECAFSADVGGADEFEKYGRKNRREEFLNAMDEVVPWSELEALVEPHYPKAGNGRQPIGLSILLRVYFLQQWFNLSDPGAEDALYESPVLPRFAGVDLGRGATPDETTILRFRRLLEQYELCGKILDIVNHYLASKGLRISTGTIVDATIIAAPSSTKNSKGEDDPEMHQTQKGNQWFFGVKAHIGVDSKEGIVRTRCALRLPRCRTCTCCPIYCTALRRRSEEMQATKGKEKLSMPPCRKRRA